LTPAYPPVRTSPVHATDQFTLKFPPRQRFVAAEFLHSPSNTAALTWLARTPDWPNQRLAIWGEAGNGKTHLIHIWAERVGAVLLHGASLHGLPDLPRCGGIALDEADATADEAALLHLLNAACEAGLPLLMAGREPPSRWQTNLPDLASRLRAVSAVEIGAPDDELLRALLVRLISERQLLVSEVVYEWLLRRLPRTPGALRDAVARLDEVALAGGSAITRTLASSALADMIGSDTPTSPPCSASR
jgi:chromosomal replication initiation ATPase DnaA